MRAKSPPRWVSGSDMTASHAAASDERIRQAAQRLLQGGLVAFPTETVYGLGADAENIEAVARIYAAKGRPANHPVIVHLPPDSGVDYWAKQVPPEARQLIEAFWPGPLTLILPRADHIPDAVSGGQATIGLRCPSHPVAQALLRCFSELKGGHGGVAAPSANQFGQVSPTLAEHVRAEFSNMGEDNLLIVEGGASQVGIESTILDLSRLEQGIGPVILRPGHVTAADIGRVLGTMPVDFSPASIDSETGQADASSSPQAPRVSGSLKAHYAPRTPLWVLPREALVQYLENGLEREARHAFVVFEGLEDASSCRDEVDWIVVKEDSFAYARDLYALLRRLDQGGYDRLIFEQPPRSVSWQAVNDRLGRAAAAFGR